MVHRHHAYKNTGTPVKSMRASPITVRFIALLPYEPNREICHCEKYTEIGLVQTAITEA